MEEIIAFSFFISNQPDGVAKRSLSGFLQQLAAAKIKLRTISASGDRQRFKIYCVPEDPAKLRAFLKSAKIRATERAALFVEYKDVTSCLYAFDKIAISAFDFNGFDATVVAQKALGFMWSDKPFQ